MTLTWVLLKILRDKGPLSIRSLANELIRDYKNVHTDVRKLEYIGLIVRTEDGKIEVPWDVVEARLMLAAELEIDYLLRNMPIIKVYSD